MSRINIVLHEPEIPQNTGNIARTCAATGARLHLVEPMGFKVDDKKLKRAGLDYWHLLDITYYKDTADFFEKNKDGILEKHEKKIYYSSAIGIDPDVKRYYPYGTLASNVIGFTGTDDIGRSGIELKYDSALTGTPGRIITAQNGKSDTRKA